MSGNTIESEENLEPILAAGDIMVLAKKSNQKAKEQVMVTHVGGKFAGVIRGWMGSDFLVPCHLSEDVLIDAIYRQHRGP